MKNIGLVITTKSAFFDFSSCSALAAFERSGYDFSEIRVLRPDSERVKAAICELEKLAKNVMVFVDCPLAEVVRWAQEATGATLFGGSDRGGVLQLSSCTLFLLSMGDEAYAKEVCLPYLAQKSGCRIGSMVLRCVGAQQARMQEILAHARNMSAGRANILHEGQFGEDIIRIFYDENTPRMLTEDLLRYLAEALRDNLYALDDTPLEKQLIELLRLRGRKISVAESFTGGGLAQKIVSVSGASEVYVEGLNTYSETSKMRRLGVTEYTLRSQGVVSEQTAYEMAAGLLSQGGCNVAIATTGLAGPNGDGTATPVGTCCIAVGIDSNVYVYRYLLEGGRREVTETAIRYALFLACKQLKNM